MEKVQKESRSESDWTLELWEARKSPKRKPEQGRLDVRVTGRQEKVQKRSQRVPDWTLKWKNPQKSPKQASQSIIHILTIR